MKGDFTRDTFDEFRHFSRVLMQQGRVQLDADFNEQAAILLHYLRTLAADLIGPYGGPEGEHGFKISFSESNDGNFTIGMGRYYVNGILCENGNDIKYLDQECFKNLPSEEKNALLPAAQGAYFVYLDVWERHITHVQDRRIRESALGEPDTCTRAQVVWQVTLSKPQNSEITCDTAIRWLEKLRKLSLVKMKARLQPAPDEGDACSIPPESRYRGLENHLYRIEVHRSGEAWDGRTNAGGTPAGNFSTAATFKWSRDNGSVVFPIVRQIVRQQVSVVTVQSLGRDQRTGLQVGDWVEILDDDRELGGKPGILAQVAAPPDPVEMTVTLESADPSITWPLPLYDENSSNHPLLRRWDHGAVEGLAMDKGAILIHESNPLNDGWIEIEEGIEVQFQPVIPGGAEYRTGDYWLVPARVATGKLDWPPEVGEHGRVVKDSEGRKSPKAESPHGIKHYYAPLAVIQDRKVPSSGGDCRCPITPPCPKPPQPQGSG